ncbi:MAG: class I SAM-dependent methyltransferase [Deltaproteobacteria bacterium]|nr:class I SAM-dependent methyltransferase [Deltaproteobacteria bacterium]
MRLSDAEFDAMNSRARRVLQRCVEWPLFKRMGLGDCAGKDVVEVGCGSGYGAALVSSLGPASYVGFDVMPEQIDIARRRGLANASFLVADATDAGELADECADFVVIFGILHHVESWRAAVAQCRRLLRPGGILLVEEPDGTLLRGWDRVFAWGHPQQGFTLAGLEYELDADGLELEDKLVIPGVFGLYRARRRAVAAPAVHTAADHACA